MSLEVLKEIKMTEEQAAGLVEQARDLATKRLEEAKRAAAGEIEEARSRTKVKIREALGAATKEGEEEIAHLRIQHETAKNRIRDMGRKNTLAAVSLIVKRIAG